MKTLALVLLSIATLSLTARSQDNSKALYPAVPPALMQAELVDRAGLRFKLEDYRGRVVLVNAWGVWSGPCRRDISNLTKLYKEYSSFGLEVIGLNIGDGNGNAETRKAIERFRTSMKIKYRLAKAVTPTETIKALFAISKQPVVPQTILIDREGRIRGIFVGSGLSVFDLRKETVKRVIAEK